MKIKPCCDVVPYPGWSGNETCHGGGYCNGTAEPVAPDTVKWVNHLNPSEKDCEEKNLIMFATRSQELKSFTSHRTHRQRGRCRRERPLQSASSRDRRASVPLSPVWRNTHHSNSSDTNTGNSSHSQDPSSLAFVT